MKATLPLLLILTSLICSCERAKDDTSSGESDDSSDSHDSEDSDSSVDSEDSEDSGDTQDSQDSDDTDDTSDPGEPRPQIAAHVISGDITWTVDFDATSEAAGYRDCSYSRSYSGLEFLDQPYLCPSCMYLLRGDAVMYEGHADCYEPLFGGAETQQETWGIDWPSSDGGIGAFYRASTANYPMTQSLATIPSVSMDSSMRLAWSSDYTLGDLDLSGSGGLTLSAEGSATLTIDKEQLIVDYRVPRAEPYACGWPLDNPGTLSSDHLMDYNAVLPRFWMEDNCGELVDAWDFYGRYLVVDSSQPDCYYCQLLADEADAGLAAMRAAGIEVEFVTLLGNGLSDPLSEPTSRNYSSWLSSFGDDEPVFKDRGYGYAVYAPFTESVYGEGSFGFPAIAVVRPDMTLIDAWPGYPSGGWADIQAMIESDMH